MAEPHEQSPPTPMDDRGHATNTPGGRPSAGSAGKGVALATGVGGLVLGLIIGGIGGFVTGVSAEDSSMTNSQPQRASNNESSSEPNENAEPDRDFPGKNVAVEAPGVTLTVLSVEEGPSASIREEGRRADVAEILTTDAAPGQKFITIMTEVENTGKMPWDLTCGAAVQATLFDPEERQFASVDELYRVPGNPDCNANTQPGQTVPMTWRYEVPESVVPKYFGFREFGFDFQSNQSLTAVDLDQ